MSSKLKGRRSKAGRPTSDKKAAQDDKSTCLDEDATGAVSEESSTLADFPADSKNPFTSPSCESDVVLVVERKKLFVHKSFLSVHSPVFRAMFTADFAEKDAKEITLPGKKYDAMVQFLLHMYPPHSYRHIKDDRVLVQILPLSQEYQANHIRGKCETYIERQLRKQGERLSIDTKILYLLLSERYGIEQHFERLLELCSTSRHRIDDIEKCQNFSLLAPATQMDLFRRRCRLDDGRLGRY